MFRVARLPGAALYQPDNRITECRSSDPAASCAHPPTLNNSAYVHVQRKGNIIRHKIKFFEPYNNACFLAIWHYFSENSHLYCIHFTIIMCTAMSISEFTHHIFTQCRTCALKNNLDN